ncbi:MAG: hypothetical protein CVU05_02365 [Bacteroidetes bacterium HGW-Bacteroidetes-21]|nr:MAG: hypothetical protein CVU05_02365 [Bacteroidetes bacterium HGW-Bacteroidetes-21]
MIRISFILLLASIQFTFAQKESFELKEGDIIFQDYHCGPLCAAIAEVTPSYENRGYTHCGMLIFKDNHWLVFEAISPVVCLTPLDSFLNRTETKEQNTLARVKPNYEAAIKNATTNYSKYLGKAYDDYFIPDNDLYYCSELLFLLYIEDGGFLFSLEPMTFKRKGQTHFMPEWLQYFDALSCSIPEGVPGNSPGKMSLSEKITVLGDF